jgi:hypothetical protein
MSLATEIAASVQRITLDVRVDGRAVSEVIEVSVSLGFDQANAQATLFCRARPSWAEEGKAVEIWAGYNGQTALIFRGELSGITWEDGPARVGLDCRDLLARTRLPWGGGEYEDAEIDDAALIRNRLEKMGIPSSVAHIESSGWVLGTVFPILLKDGDVSWSLIEEIDTLAGHRTFTDSAGVIRRMRVSGTPGAEGAYLITTAQLLEKPRRVRSRDGIINKCVVTGLTYEGLVVGGPGVAEAQANNPYVPNPPGYITEEIQSDLVEDDATALAIARRVVSDKNRRPESLELPIVGDPRIQPGMTLTVEADGLETGSANVFVEHVDHRIGQTFVTTIRTTGGTLSGYIAGEPVAIFDLQLFLEGEDTGAGVEALLVATVDGNQSYDPDGQIVDYAWTVSATGATPEPASGSGPVFRFVVDAGATDLTITLTVTDADDLTGTLTRTLPVPRSQALVEDLYTAEGVLVACSSDGEQTWREATPTDEATCLAPFAPDWGQIWGLADGHIVATFDKLQSDLVDLGAPHGAVACTAVWVHERDTTRVWAGFADGAVAFGQLDRTAQTAAWSVVGTIPEGPVQEIRESYGVLGGLRATAGAAYYGSEDAGTSWSLLHTFDTAWRMAAGFERNLASGLNSDPPLFEEGGLLPTIPSGVTHIRGITMGWRTWAIYAADDAANLYATGPDFAALADTLDDAPAGVNHMIRSGNLDGVVYLGCGDGSGDNGAAKWIPGTKPPFWIRRTDARPTYMVAYGPAHQLPITVSLLMVGAGAFASGVRRFVNGVWVDVSGNLPESGWRGIIASPAAPETTWIVWSKAAAYLTENGGSTWTEITGIGNESGSLNAGLGLSQGIVTMAWSADGTRWAAGGSGGDSFFLTENGFVSVGEGTAQLYETDWPIRVTGSEQGGFPQAMVWVGTAVIVSFYHSNPEATCVSWARYAGGDTPYSGYVAVEDTARATALDRLGEATVYGLGVGDNGSGTIFHQLYRVDDARTGTASPVAAHTSEFDVGIHGATMAAVAGNAVYVVSASEIETPMIAGLWKIDVNSFDPPQLLIDGDGSFVRADQRTHTALAVLYQPSGGGVKLAVFDGETWNFDVVLPGVLGDLGYTAYVEVIA